MKKMKSLALVLWVFAGLITFVSCSDDDDPIPALTLSSLKAGTVVLDGTAAATDIPVDATVTATFSAAVDATTVNAPDVTLTKGTEVVGLTFTVSGATVTIAPAAALEPGTEYTLSIKSTVVGAGKETFAGVTFTFTTAGKVIVVGPQVDHLVAQWLFDGNTDDYTGNQTVAQASNITYVADREGNANGAASFDGDGDIVEITYKAGFVTPSMSFSCWIKVDFMPDPSTAIYGLGGASCLFVEMGNGWIKPVTMHTNTGTGADNPAHNWMNAINGGGGEPDAKMLYNFEGSVQDLVNGNWVQLILTYDAAASLKTFYIDGVKMRQEKIKVDTDTEWELTDIVIRDSDEDGKVLNKNFVIGAGNSPLTTITFHDWSLYTSKPQFKGLMDDFRVYDVALSAAEVTSLYNAEKVTE